MRNTVELIGIYGDDETIALSAWTSTDRELTEEKRKRIPGLITKLWNDGHETPFEKSAIHFLITTDIATHIQILKHRIGVSVNAESARYRELRDGKYYVPEDWTEQWKDKLIEHTLKGNQLYHDAITELEPIIGRNRAKESARFFKSYNSQITSDVMFNMRSFAHFLGLRIDPLAQVEIREIAVSMLEFVRQSGKFENTLNAMGY